MGQRTPNTHDALFSELVALMARLRSPSGCPWDREQDHRSLRPNLLEETYEVLEAIDRDDHRALCQELGDLLLQVIFHAQLASEAGRFDIADVVTAIRDKLIARHPHVFGQTSAETPQEVLHQWDSLKRSERGDGGADLVTGVPSALPALARAQLVQRRAARAGTSRTAQEARTVAEEALARLGAGLVKPALAGGVPEPRPQATPSPAGPSAEATVGKLLLAVVDLAQAAGVDAEQVLRERIDQLVGEVRARARAPDAATRPRAGPS